MALKNRRTAPGNPTGQEEEGLLRSGDEGNEVGKVRKAISRTNFKSACVQKDDEYSMAKMVNLIWVRGTSCNCQQHLLLASKADDENLEPGTYWLSRIVLLRALSGIYFVAFLVAFDQNCALIGQHGLTPFR